MKKYLLTCLIIIFFFTSCSVKNNNQTVTADYWAKYLSKEIKVEGMAYNSKLGAVLQITNQERSIWIYSLASWPEGYYGKKVEVTGIVIKMHDLPVYIEKEGEPAKSGIPVPEGTDLYSASKRYLLKNAKWKLIE